MSNDPNPTKLDQAENKDHKTDSLSQFEELESTESQQGEAFDSGIQLSEQEESEADFSFDFENSEAPAFTLEAMSTEESPRQGLMRWDEALTLEGQVEAILFAAPKPLSVTEIIDILRDDEAGPEPGVIEAHIQALVKLYKERNGGFRLEHDKGVGYQFRTVPAAALLMERMFSSRQRPLSRAALETLSIIAYRQPVTRADIEYIRGVDAGSIIKNLLERDLIACVGRKEDAGRPMMFGTTAEFLRVFRLPTLNDLPPLAAFQPAPELMAEAMQKLETQTEDVDVDEFMADPDLEAPFVSQGLTEIAGSEDFTDSAADFQVRESGILPEESPVTRAGASYDSEGFEEDYARPDNTHSEVAVPTGSSLETRGGADAPARPDLSERQDRSRDGYED